MVSRRDKFGTLEYNSAAQLTLLSLVSYNSCDEVLSVDTALENQLPVLEISLQQQQSVGRRGTFVHLA